MTNGTFPQIGNTPSSQPLAGAFNIDQMPGLSFQNGASAGILPDFNIVTATNTTGFTATQPQIASALDSVLFLTGTLGGGANIQLPTVASAAGAIAGNEVIGNALKLRIVNASSANFAWTVTTNTGVTLVGTMTIAQNTWRDFIAQVTAVSNGTATAVTVTSVGTGTYS